DQPRAPGQTAASAPGGRDSKSRQFSGIQGERASSGGNQSGSRERSQEWQIQRRPFLQAQRGNTQSSSFARETRRHPAAGGALSQASHGRGSASDNSVGGRIEAARAVRL